MPLSDNTKRELKIAWEYCVVIVFILLVATPFVFWPYYVLLLMALDNIDYGTQGILGLVLFAVLGIYLIYTVITRFKYIEDDESKGNHG